MVYVVKDIEIHCERLSRTKEKFSIYGIWIVSFLWGFRHGTCVGKWRRWVSDANRWRRRFSDSETVEGWVRQGGEEETAALKEEEEELTYVMLGL